MIAPRRLLTVLFAALVLLAISVTLIRLGGGSKPITSAPAKATACERDGKPYSEGALVKAPDGKGILRCSAGEWLEQK